jgi:hypothetical protein
VSYLHFFTILAVSVSAQAEMIFLDLNDAREEIAHCRAGLTEKSLKENRGERRPEQLHVVDPAKYTSKRGESSLKSKTYHALRAKIQDMNARNVPIDSIVISGEAGNGDFFGSQGKFHQNELFELVNEFPQFAKAWKSAGLWGCYPSNVDDAEQFWFRKIPNLQYTKGFVGQAPNKDRQANHVLMKQFCERRQDDAKATSLDELCRIHDSIQQLTTTTFGLCNRRGIASRQYSEAGRPEKCFTYKQLHDRCPSFINKREYDAIYTRYLRGDSEVGEESKRQVDDLRRYYNEMQKWRHCADQFRHQRGHEMPNPGSVIRLIKYKKIKENLAKLNATQLADYDEMLDEAGLGALKLGDITRLSRKAMNGRITAAVQALVGRRTEDPALLRMAKCMDQTFVKMNHKCSPFDAIGDYAKTRSICVLSASEAEDERGKNDPC